MKPKLAEGSRWEGDVAVDEDGDRVRCIQYEHVEVIRVSDDEDRETARLMSTDALAAIRAAGLDPVWSAAVKLRQYVGSPGATRIGLDELISKLCDAVYVSGEKEPSDG